MPSPFPGMNPYLEHRWKDFHEAFIPAARAVLQRQVQPKYFVGIEENLVIHDWNDKNHPVGSADVAVGRASVPSGMPVAGAVIASPARGSLPIAEGERLSYLEIRTVDGEQLVTVIELISPSNKRGRDREQYLRKRSEILQSTAHFVEIDLTRSGSRLPVNGLTDCAYYVAVSRAENRPEADLWPIGLRDALPTIPIPLIAPDSDVRLDLQSLLHSVYDEAGYAARIYRRPPDPPLSPEDNEWAQQFVPAAHP